jgi:hypothetical protein
MRIGLSAKRFPRSRRLKNRLRNIVSPQCVFIHMTQSDSQVPTTSSNGVRVGYTRVSTVVQTLDQRGLALHLRSERGLPMRAVPASTASSAVVP